MQENTQNNIIRKLNSYARYARLKTALFEYNKIFKSTHILNLIDNMQLRKALRTARNRTESYYQLQVFIRKIYHGAFKGKRIINTVYEKIIKDGVSQEVIDEFCRISPIAWVHILFTDRYSFKKSNGVIDVAKMARWLVMHMKKHFWKVD